MFKLGEESSRAGIGRSLQGRSIFGLVLHRDDGRAWTDSHLDHQHANVRELLKLPEEFVLHSLRHTFGTRLGEAGTGAVTIMKLMGHSTITISQRYVHPSPEAVELAFERLTALNLKRAATVSATVIDSKREAVAQVV